MIKKVLAMALFSSLMGYSYSSTCTAPVFSSVEEFQERVSSVKSLDTQEFTTVRLKRIASLNLPGPFFDVFYSSSLGFRNPSKDLTLDISYQGVSEVAEFEVNNITPYKFFETLFESPSGEAQCMYLDAFDVDRQDYRVSFSSSNGKVFAFGSKDLHRIYILNNKRQSDVVTIVFKTFDVRYIFDIFKSVQLME